ncbi:MAG: DNA mismatch repair protein MutS [Bacteroidales bacterium]|nr:DNA mismatch repair protein MutS [Bacteroidales bacterium]
MAKNNDGVTPLMKQYAEFKAKYPDCILLYRVGDFYETFGDDAQETAKILNIVLTKRSSNGQDRLAGFPYHALDTYLPKFLQAGKRVAICDQIEDPKFAKGIVKRGVSEIVTPGISYNDGAFDGSQSNYLCAVHKQKDLYGAAFIDILSGEFLVFQGSFADVSKLLKDFNVKEIVLQRQFERNFLAEIKENILTKTYDDWVFTLPFAEDILNQTFSVSGTKGFGIDNMPLAVIAAGAALYYIKDTNHKELSHICNISRIDNGNYVWMDSFTIRNLELVYSSGGEKATLFNVINRTQSNMGARLLKHWLLLPLKDKKEIEKRQKIVGLFVYDDEKRDRIKELIGNIGDMERLVGKISFKRIQPNELYRLADILQSTEELKKVLLSFEQNADILPQTESFKELKEFILSAVDENAPNNINKGNAIKSGFDKQLDYYRNIAFNSQEVLDKIQAEQSEITGIPSLKVGFNNVFGYYLEVTNIHKDKVPPSWQRKQTLTNCERYITPQLKEIETQILSAQENISSLESSLYFQVLEKLIPYIPSLQQTAHGIAYTDCLLSFALTAIENNYTRPQILDTDILHISKARHPVIEKMLPIGTEYVANDVYLDTTTQQIIVITGPNMSGKSAYLRQTALIVILAQMGSYVPAKRAEIGIVDKIFTRVGASDNIASGESTFMVEMNETASILNNLSPHSLVLLDEIGRGTSTYDGVSIAWAIAAYLHDNKNKAKVLFATHYHELIAMEKHFDRIKNYHIAVKELGNKIIFLRTIAKGGSSQSFGLHVARLAGIPKEVLKTADGMLLSLEENRSDSLQLGIDEGENNRKKRLKEEKEAKKQAVNAFQTSFIQLEDPILLQIKDELLHLDIDNLTPINALNELNKIKKLLKNI